jgi:thiamine-phosphate diphosphorylase
MTLGVSTHDEAQVFQALRDGADYVAVGSMFPTGSKAGFQLVGPGLLRKLRPQIGVPLVAIGGITEDNLGEVVAAGADAVAVISAVCAAADPAAATRELLARIQASRDARDRR